MRIWTNPTGFEVNNKINLCGPEGLKLMTTAEQIQ